MKRGIDSLQLWRSGPISFTICRIVVQLKREQLEKLKFKRTGQREQRIVIVNYLTISTGLKFVSGGNVRGKKVGYPRPQQRPCAQPLNERVKKVGGNWVTLDLKKGLHTASCWKDKAGDPTLARTAGSRQGRGPCRPESAPRSPLRWRAHRALGSLGSHPANKRTELPDRIVRNRIRGHVEEGVGCGGSYWLWIHLFHTGSWLSFTAAVFVAGE